VGNWNTGSLWSGGVVPGPGDLAILDGSPGDVVSFDSLTVAGVTIDVTTMPDIHFQTATFDAASRLVFDNSTSMFWSVLNTTVNNGFIGTVTGTGQLQFILNSGPDTELLNNGTLSLSQDVASTGFGTLDNAGLMTYQNVLGTPLSWTTTGLFNRTVNTGVILVDGSLGPSPASTQIQFENVQGNGSFNIASAEADFTGTVDPTQTFNFLDGNGELILNLGSAPFGAAIGGFRAGDTIDLGTSNVDNVVYSDGTLTLSNGGTPTGQLIFSGAYTNDEFHLTAAGLSDFVLTTTAVACFAAGTAILTGAGELPVEAVRPGMTVPTRAGLRRVRWVGRRRVDLVRHPAATLVAPVLVRAGAFAPGLPRRDLRLSPDHAVWDEATGTLVPIRCLVNGMTILRLDVDEVTYHHVELDRHAVLFAEGLPTESYLDTGNRGDFEGEATTALHPLFAAAARPAACAPLRLDGDDVTALRRRLAGRAGALGYRRGEDAGLHVEADGRLLRPDGDGYALPPGTRALRLRSRSFVPVELEPPRDDRRRLGVALTDVRFDGEPAPATAFASGFHGPEPELRWTDGDAVLLVPPGARRLDLQVLAPGCYVSAPDGDPVARSARG
jgi:hypothetical protein